MKVQLDSDKCQGHGMCNMVCPDVFRFDDQGYAQLIPGMEKVPSELLKSVQLAEMQCPEQAIRIIGKN